MSDLPRILVLIGSGETSPSMAPLHREVLGRFGESPIAATLIDTPYGFQENATEITMAAVAYFAERLRNPISVASFRRSDTDILERQVALGRIRDAAYVFCGPGSPSYALRHWADSDIPALLAQKLTSGGALVMASAAALTLGRLTPPVYEIYKVGEDPRWLQGLDLLSPFGLPVAVIPHYDNAEGTGHDTRFCFLGERRFRQLEAEMPDESFILGIDEHTSLVLDLGAGRASVRGRRSVTVRRRGRSVTFKQGAEMTIDALRMAAFDEQAHDAGAIPLRSTPAPDRADLSVRASVDECQRAFRDALGRLDLQAAVRSILTLDELVGGTPDADRDAGLMDARTALRSMVVRLAEIGRAAIAEREQVGPLTDALVEIRRTARTDRDWAGADAIRERLAALGVELHDTAEGTTWSRQKKGDPMSTTGR